MSEKKVWYIYLASHGVIPFTSLPNKKILYLSRLKAIADDKINVTKKKKFVLAGIVGKAENACYQNFLLFPTMFSKGFFLQVTKNRIVWQRNYVLE